MKVVEVKKGTLLMERRKSIEIKASEGDRGREGESMMNAVKWRKRKVVGGLDWMKVVE